MISAAVDIGTNTLRLLIKDIKNDNVIFRKNYYLLLGKSCENDILSKKGFESLYSVLTEIKELVHKYNVSKVFGVATAFARKIKNSEELFDLIKSVLPCDIKLIDGETEGRIVASALSDGFKLLEDFLIIDVGGGSTEFIYKSRKGLSIKSLEIGSLSLAKNFFSVYPPTQKDIKSLVMYVKNSLVEIPKSYLDITYYGVGGTFTTVAFLLTKQEVYNRDLINGFKLKLTELERFFDEVVNFSEEEIKERYPLEHGREKVLLSGVIEVLTIMRTLGINEIIVSDISLIDGVFTYFGNVG